MVKKGMRRIFYECLDLTFPVGGVRRLYRHVEILARHGFDAYILHHGVGFRTPWFESSAPIRYWTNDFEFRYGDVLVIPEGHTSAMRHAMRLQCERIVIALNWANICRNLTPGESWAAFGIKHAIAGGAYEYTFIKSTMGVDCTTISSGIDTDLFRPSPNKQLIISVMPRKNPDFARIIEVAFRAKYPMHSDVQFVRIDMLPHADVAKILSRSAIFLAHTFPEGLSRKTLEAMACGNIVVGFAGRGSKECMEHLINCYLVDDGDLLGAVEMLDNACRSAKAGSCEPMKRAAIETAHRYSLESEEAAVVGFWEKY